MTKRIRGVKVIIVKNLSEGEKVAYDLLLKTLNKDSVLFLSGGKTPENLYKKLALNQELYIGAVGLVDERYVKPLHKGSNEEMIQRTGLLTYLKSRKIPFYSILKDKSLEDTAADYSDIVYYLFRNFNKRIGILGVGEDGHTAGIPVQSQSSKVESKNYVEWFDNFPGEFKKRITLAFKALSEMDLLIVLIFGAKKKKAVKLMLQAGSEAEVPARFYLRLEIVKKTILITDQKV